MSHKSMGDLSFEFTNIDSAKTYQNTASYIVKIKARSTESNNLSLSGFVYMDVSSKLLPSVKLPPGNYSIKINFPLYITQSLSFDVNYTAKTILKIQNHPIIENITMSVHLTNVLL